MEPPVLEEWIELPGGNRARRCQHVDKKGRQCGAPAAHGGPFCWRHGTPPKPRPPKKGSGRLSEEAREALEAEILAQEGLVDLATRGLTKKGRVVHDLLEALVWALVSMRA